MSVQDFIATWQASGGSERANKDSFLLGLASLLGVEPPRPRTGDRDRDRYCFEADAVVPHEGGTISIGKMDLYKAGCFVLEAKQGSHAPGTSVGTARRGTPAWNIAMRDAFGQALGYARTLAEPPPFLVVCDLGHCLDLYAAFDGTLDYRPFPDALCSRLFLADIERHLPTLRAIWTDPGALDPARKKARVTRDIAGHVAELSAALEDSGHPPELVAKFLMRCLFTMFAEVVGLLPEGLFTRALEERWCTTPGAFVEEVEELWQRMNTGGRLYGVGKILRFNGGLFAEPRALPLSAGQLRTLLGAAHCHWADVEPAIFGTLLERALSREERHALGAHYTPRAYVERLVKPTLEEPLRAEWDLVRVEARQLVGAGDLEAARRVAGEFHRQLCQLKVLDPACGTGNFLYVALDTLKRLEAEVLALLDQLGDTQSAFGGRVSPAQFLGIEVKPWAREIADLVLWIGFLSWNARQSGRAAAREPVLERYGNIECRDAVLAYDRVEPVLDEGGHPVTRWDGESLRAHPVTGKMVPDDTRRVPVERYVNPRAAEWPDADFVVGNPPFIGNKRMRDALGDGYAEALRAAYPDVASTVDFVMYWWHKAARLARAGRVSRFGFITTNSVTQTFNRSVLEAELGADKLAIRWAVPDHPWVSEGAAVRIAMTVAEPAGALGTAGSVGRVVREAEDGAEVVERAASVIHADLRAGANVSSCTRLRSNRGLSCPGVQLSGQGFVLNATQAASFRGGTSGAIIVPYLIGRDLTQTPSGSSVIDTFGWTEDALRESHPELYQHLLVHVKPMRESNPRGVYAKRWWLHAEPRARFRAALGGLSRYVGCSRTARHRTFAFVEAGTLAETKVQVFAFADALVLGVLSSRVHTVFSETAGAFLGVGNDPTYNHSDCFDPFPFPTPTEAQSALIRDLGERLDAHRKSRQAAHPELTLTGMYNVLAMLRAGEPLNDKERTIHERGLVSILREIHDALDMAVLDAYGWPRDLDDESILEHLVALNRERADEEKRGLVRWLRPDYQRPLAGEPEPEALTLPGLDSDTPAVATGAAEPAKWPATLSDRIAAVRSVLDTSAEALDTEAVARRFKSARRGEVTEILDSLAALGLALVLDTPAGRRWRRAG